MMLGWVGVTLLLIAYVLLITKYSNWFVPVNIIASFVLTIHAITINDTPFILVNGFITGLLLIKQIRG